MKVKKYKICRRLGSRVFSKCENPGFSPTPKQQKGKNKGRRAMSEFGTQLLDKQRVRYTYNVRERQFEKYIRAAAAKKGANPAETLFRALETRLDNVVFRLGLAKSRAAARQAVSHGHIMVNERKVTVPSYQVRPGDAVHVRPQSRDSALFAGLSERLKEHSVPAWLIFDEKKYEGTVKTLPAPGDASAESMNLTSVIEFYGR